MPGTGPVSLVCRDLGTGNLRWQRPERDLAWLRKVRRCVYHGGVLVCEISTLSDLRQGNAIQVLSPPTGPSSGAAIMCRFPVITSKRRAMFARDLLWIIEDLGSEKGVGLGLEPRSGIVKRTCQAALTHCFPPVATSRYLCCGEMKLCDLETGVADVILRSRRWRAGGTPGWCRPTA